MCFPKVACLDRHQLVPGRELQLVVLRNLHCLFHELLTEGLQEVALKEQSCQGYIDSWQRLQASKILSIHLEVLLLVP